VAIDSPEELSPTEQSTILADLRHALRQEDDESVREDIRRLLGALRRRSEVTLATVDQIDDLLRRHPSPAGEAATLSEPQPAAAYATKGSTPAADSPAISVAEPATPDRTEFTKSRWSIRNPKTLAIAAGAVVLIAIIAVAAYMLLGRTSPGPTPDKTATSTSQSSPPVPPAALDGLLLSTDQINSAMGATAMTVATTSTEMWDIATGISDKACLVSTTAQVAVYAGSGWTAVRAQELHEPGDTFAHVVDQAVVTFPTAAAAASFFTASTQSWPACSNRQYTYVPQDKPPVTWTVGAVSNNNGTLSVQRTQEGGNGSGVSGR
jgi:serine/threonine-protein kinase